MALVVEFKIRRVGFIFFFQKRAGVEINFVSLKWNNVESTKIGPNE